MALVDCSADPFIPGGYNWRVARHVKAETLKIDSHVGTRELYVGGRRVDFYLSPRQMSGAKVRGSELYEELSDKPVLNANILSYLLKNPHLIPYHWKKVSGDEPRFIYFWGTIYRADEGTALFVPCLCWGAYRWRWSYRWLEYEWREDCPAALLAD